MEKIKSYWIKIIIIFSSCFLLYLMHALKISQPIETFITYAFKPFQAPLYKFSMRISNDDILKEKNFLIEENNNLKNKVAELSVKNSEILKTSNECTQALGQADFLNNEAFDFISAKIINKITTDTTQIISLNQGHNKGILPGQAVVAGDGVIIGKISEVEGNISKAILLTSNSSKSAGVIMNSSNSPGLIIGQHGLGLKMDMIPKGDEITKGDSVITSGEEERIPKGLTVGSVDQIINQPSDLFNSATLIPPIDYNKLSIISIIIK